MSTVRHTWLKRCVSGSTITNQNTDYTNTGRHSRSATINFFLRTFLIVYMQIKYNPLHVKYSFRIDRNSVVSENADRPQPRRERANPGYF